MRKIKKTPHSLYASVSYNGIDYSIKLHGRSRKRVIVFYWYVDATGGYLPNLETSKIYDETFQESKKAREIANNFFIDPKLLENILTKRYDSDYILENASAVEEYKKSIQ